MSKPIRIGIIGAGGMTVKRHLPALKRLEGEKLVTLIVLCDINIETAKKAAATFDINEVTDKAESVIERDDIDAVCIFAPAEVHYRYGLMTMESGKHLFVEKPPAPTTEKLLEMDALAKKKQVVAVAGLNRRFQRNIAIIRERIAADAILTAEATFHKSSAGVPAPFGMQSWLGVSAIHALDTLCYVMGQQPTALYTVKNGDETDENFSAIIEWGDRHAVFSSNNSAGARLEQYVFHGYGISFSSTGPELVIERENGEGERFENPADSNGGIYEEFKAFVEAVESGQEPAHALSQVISSLYLVERIEAGHQGPLDWSFMGKASTDQPTEKIIETKEVIAVDEPMVLVLNPDVLKGEMATIRKKFTVVYEDTLATLSDIEKKQIVAIFTGGAGATKATEKMFADLPSVSVLGVVGASVKKWGGEEALERQVGVINTADVLAEAVAEFILMQAIVGLRKASVSHDVLRKGGWEFSIRTAKERLLTTVRQAINLPAFSSLKTALRPLATRTSASLKPTRRMSSMLAGKKVALIGFGEITKKTIPLFQSFGCQILIVSDYLDADEADKLGVKIVSMAEALRADVVSMQRGLSLRTEKAFGSQEINLLRPGAVFINSGRARLVDNKALKARLRKGDIFACLDVFDEEPPAVSDEFRQLKNVFLTAHIAGSLKHVDGLTEASSRKLVQKVIDYLENNGSASIQSSDHYKNMT